MEPESKFNLDLLPPEMVTRFLLKLDLKDLANYCQTYKIASEYCKSEAFWKDKYRYDFGPPMPILTSGEKWIEIHKQRKMRNAPISAGYWHFAIIDDQGILYTAGRNFAGQLGDGTKHPRKTLIRLKSFTKKVISVSCGARFTIAITEDGKTYLWGEKPFYEEIRDRAMDRGEDEEYEDEEEDANIHSLVPVLIDRLKNHKAVKVSCGESGWGVILENGSVYYNILPEYFSHYPLAGFITLENRAIDLSVHSYQVAIVTEKGKVYVFGDSFSGEMVGIQGSPEKYSIHPVQVPLPEKIKQISLRISHIMALSVEGNIFAWGCEGAALGVDRRVRGEPPETYHTPTRLMRLPKISYIYSNDTLLSAVTDDGRLYIWGRHEILNNFVAQSKEKAREVGISGGFNSAKLPIEIDIGYRINYVGFTRRSILAISRDGVVNRMGKPIYEAIWAR